MNYNEQTGAEQNSPDVYDEEENYTDEQEYEEYDEEEEYGDEDENEEKPKKRSPLLLILLLLIFFGALGFFLLSKGGAAKVAQKNGANQNSETVQNIGFEQNGGENNGSFEGSNDNNFPQEGENQPNDNNEANAFFEPGNNDNDNMMSVNFNDNGETNVVDGENENAPVATVSEQPQEQIQDESSNDLFENQEDNSVKANDSIMVVYNKAARPNPFKPPVIEEEKTIPYETIGDAQFEIIEPPAEIQADDNLTRLLQTQISGILYDGESPSAIVNLNGLDQFVKIGDTVSGYKIEDITRDKVQINYKNNTYVASVGQLFVPGSLEKRAAIVNLENKFAGRYKN